MKPKLFTRKDIEIVKLEETIRHDDEPFDLYMCLNEFAAQGIHVIDVTLVSTYSDQHKTHNHYMIRIVRPVYDVEIRRYFKDSYQKWDLINTDIFGYFKSEDEAIEFKKEYLKKSNADVKFEADINLHSPLEQII